MNYAEAIEQAQQRADASGRDYGVAHNALLHGYYVVPLPRRENRYGAEVRCEIVCPSTWAEPGHGPVSPRRRRVTAP